MLVFVSLIVLVIWLVLFFAWGNFWQIWEFDSDRAQFPAPAEWPRVTAVVPARNEAASIEAVIRAFAAQDYAGGFSVIVVDDHSDDGTARLAFRAATDTNAASRVRVISAPELIGGWTGKLWGLQTGVNELTGGGGVYWVAGAGGVHAPDTLFRLGF